MIDKIFDIYVLDTCVLRTFLVDFHISNHKGVAIVEVISHHISVTEKVHHPDIWLTEIIVFVVRFAVSSINDEVTPSSDGRNNRLQLLIELSIVHISLFNTSLVAYDEDVLRVVFLDGLFDSILELPIVFIYREGLATLVTMSVQSRSQRSTLWLNRSRIAFRIFFILLLFYKFRNSFRLGSELCLQAGSHFFAHTLCEVGKIVRWHNSVD